VNARKTRTIPSQIFNHSRFTSIGISIFSFSTPLNRRGNHYPSSGGHHAKRAVCSLELHPEWIQERRFSQDPDTFYKRQEQHRQHIQAAGIEEIQETIIFTNYSRVQEELSKKQDEMLDLQRQKPSTDWPSS
jgi:hypothetical protein